jgi:5'-methylthioadenosine phosphorylase
VVVVQGPRFSTRAESASFVAAGWELINMTQMPEASLAGEAGIAVVNISVITDYDVGIGDAPPVTHEEVIRRFGESVGTLKAGLRSMLPRIAEIQLQA